jgi:hypothetical protein
MRPLLVCFLASLTAVSMSCFSEPRQHARFAGAPDGPTGSSGRQNGETPGSGALDAGNSPSSTDGGADLVGGPTDPPDAAPSAGVCGNGVIEAGEECEGNCPTACPKRGCTSFALQGSAERCTARCVELGVETGCRHDDGCCPLGCTTANDKDCSVMCDNGVREEGETCDPLSACPTTCQAQGCQLRKLVNPGTCAAECVDDRQQSVCVTGDGCCPSNCNTSNDGDCQPRCGNGVVESGEKCDPVSSCPSTCPNQGCRLRRLNAQGTCNAECVDGGMQTACRSGDDCCPPGCNANNDDDCEPRCGNGVREASERCDPLSSCPSSCSNQGCQIRTLVGAGTCEARCENGGSQTQCRSGDGCCPGPQCSFANDRECPARCGDADGMCPSGCSFNQDQDCKRPNGEDCGSNGQCQNNRCTGGVCCNNGQNGCGGRCVANNDRNACGSGCVQCGENEICRNGTCELDCGASGKRCCPSNDNFGGCRAGLICRSTDGSNTCSPCGGNQQFCCTNSDGAAIVCRAPLTCVFVTCMERSDCGLLGDPCCPGNECRTQGGCDPSTNTCV